jgi:inosose dehydratase
VEGNIPFIVLADDNGKIPERTQNAGRIKPEQGLSHAEWQVFAGAESASQAVKQKRSTHSFHHHCAGYVETPQEIDTLYV